MTSGSDYAQQTQYFNSIDNEKIGESEDGSEVIRIVCYDQPIYDDSCLEADEWLGLTLDVDRSSVTTFVKVMYEQASIVIQDQDSELIFNLLTHTCLLSFYLHTMLFYSVAVVGLEQTFFNVSESTGVVELCAIVISPHMDPDCPNCPVGFPFDVQLSTFNGDASKQFVYQLLDIS